MGWIGKTAAVLAVAMAGLAADGAVQAQTADGACRANCNTAYAACAKRAINSDTCSRRLKVCKKRCEAREMMQEAPVGETASPN